MYEVYLDGKCIYYPGDEICTLSSAELSEQVGGSSELNLTIPRTNPLWDSFIERQSMVQVLKDNKEIFYGEVREKGKDISLNRTIYAVGEISFLADSIQPQSRQTCSPLEFFRKLINIHNAQVEEKKQFKVGIVTVRDKNDSIYRYTNYEDTLSCIRDKLCDPLDGYLRIRKEDGIRYIDLVRLQDYGKTCDQTIQFGKNLLDYTDTITTDDIATAVLPLGAKLDKGNIEGLDAYTTISSVNGGKDYVYNQEAVNNFGWIKKTVNWDDVTQPENLLKKAKQWLSENQYADMEIKIKAIDLSNLNINIEAFEIGDYINVVAKPFGLNAWFYNTEKKTDILDPKQNSITLGSSIKLTYTQQVKKTNNELKEMLPNNKSDMRAVLEAAKENASNLIKTASKGNIYFINDDEGHPKELLIMDNADIDKAQKVWRFNINGLGYSSSGYNGTYGLAMTMDGAIVADYITIGILNGIKLTGNYIEGGVIRLDGENDKGLLSISNGKNSWEMHSFNIYGYNAAAKQTIIVGNSESGFIRLYGDDEDKGQKSLIDNNRFFTGDGVNSSYISMRGIGTTGTKSRIASTKDYDDRLLYCYETPSPTFGDFGECIIDEMGSCIVYIDDIFAETIDLECTYQVNLQKYGKGDCWVAKRTTAYFIVQGTPNLKLGWELKAVQKKYDTLRLEKYESVEEKSMADKNIYDVLSYINELIDDVEREDYEID